MSNARIGFVGVGLMGHGIAKNLIAKGYPVTLRAASQSRGRRRPLQAGAKEAASYAALAARQRHRHPVRHRRAAGRGGHARRRRHRQRLHARG